MSLQIQPSVVETLVSNCCNLEDVTMAGLKDITDAVALSIAHCCPEIQHISFRNCNVTDTGVCEIAVHCSQLSLLAVAGVHCLTDKSIMALAENCPYLEELYISGCDKITKQAVTYLKACALPRACMYVWEIKKAIARDLDALLRACMYVWEIKKAIA